MTRIQKMGLSTLILLAATVSLFPQRNISARIEDGWIVASQGSDESSHVVRVKVWGPARVAGDFHQLDDDPEMEYVVVSRSLGSGPYYKLQIIDFRPDGILAWSYDSAGLPKVEKGLVLLGKLPGGYEGAAGEPVYEAFRLSVKGLSKLEE